MIKTSSRGTLNQPIHSELINYIQWSLKQSESKSEPSDIRIGLNYSIILMSVVFFESSLFFLLEQLSRGIKDLDNAIMLRISEKLQNDCQKTTGLDGYSELFETLTGNKLSQVVDSQWEDLRVVFNLRNHIVHGRSRLLDVKWGDDMPIVAEHLTRLNRIEDHLKKRKLLENKPAIEIHFHDYLSISIAKWAWKTTSECALNVAETRRGVHRNFFSYLNSIDGFNYDTDAKGGIS